MPYATNKELPEAIKKYLPTHGQDIYREAFNSALAQYNDEKIAHQVAWSAVKKKYKKSDKSGNWLTKPTE